MLNINNFVTETEGSLAAKQFLFLLDCCFSGIAGKQTTLAREDPSLKTLQDYAKNRQSVQILTASRKFEPILDSAKNKSNSMFTQAIFDFLNDNDVSDFPEMFISAKKMHRKIKYQVTNDAHAYGDGKSQEPQFFRADGLDQEGEFVVREIKKSEFKTGKKKKIELSKTDHILKEADLLDIVNNLDIITDINKQIRESQSETYTASSVFTLIQEKLSNDDYMIAMLSGIQDSKNLTDEEIQEVFNHLCWNVLINGMRKGYSEPIIPNATHFKKETNDKKEKGNEDE